MTEVGLTCQHPTPDWTTLDKSQAITSIRPDAIRDIITRLGYPDRSITHPGYNSFLNVIFLLIFKGRVFRSVGLVGPYCKLKVLFNTLLGKKQKKTDKLRNPFQKSGD